MHLFYTPDIKGEEYTLNEEESKHCLRVLRLEVGDTIYLVDGRGGFYTAQIARATAKLCTVKVVVQQQNYGKRNYRLHIAMAPTKSIDRYEWFLEKATEMGIDEITPLECEHSERRTVKQDRQEKVVESAMKQSLKAYHPIVNELQPFNRFVQTVQAGKKFIAHCNEGSKPILKSLIQAGDDVLVLIGPEGDFFPQEVGLAKQHGFVEVSLGESRLRTETAGLVACCTVWLANQ